MKKKSMKWNFGALMLVIAAITGFGLMTLTSCKRGANTYTYNEYISMFPTSWNTHNASIETDTYVQLYTEMGLYALTLNEARTSHVFVDEMATGDPVDISSELVGQYGIESGESGKAWKINLNQDATWANGEKITADDYVESMKLLLDPAIRNRNAITYYNGNAAIYKAGMYYKSTNAIEYIKINAGVTYTDAEIDELIDEEKLYFSFNTSIYDFNNMPYSRLNNSEHTMHKQLYPNRDTNGENSYRTLWEGLNATSTESYILVTRENLELFRSCLGVLSANITALGVNYIPHWYSLLSIEHRGVSEYNKILATKEYAGDVDFSDEHETELEKLIRTGKVYFSFSTPIYDGGAVLYKALNEPRNDTSTGRHNMYSFLFPDKDTSQTNSYEALYNALKGSGADLSLTDYIMVTRENVEALKTYLGVLSENVSAVSAQLIPHWYNLLSVETESEPIPTEFAEVGIKKNDDYSFTLIYANPLSLWEVKYALTSNWIVYRDYYTLTQNGTLMSTNYGTTSGQYMAYGPYKLESYQVDKELVFVRNENWYGYKEGKTNYHPGEFQTDRIVAQVIENQATALTEFLSGHLDQVRLTANDLDTYKFSDNLLRRTASNTWQLSINADKDALSAIEADGQGNRKVLSNKNFRQALSLMIDRNYVGTTIAGNSAGALSFLNSNYYYDMENNSDSIYRNTPEAKRALVELYGITYGENNVYKTLDEAYAALTGYDLESARALLRTAYTEAMDNDLYRQGETIKINIYVNALTQALSAFGEYFQAQANLAAQRTGFEGKIKIEIKAGETNRLDAMRNGRIECMYSSFAGDYNDPAGFFANYVDPDQKPYEYGFNPATQSLTLNLDESEVTKTLTQWQKSIIAGGEYAGDNAKKLKIMAALEKEILSNYQTLPLWVGTDSLLYSKKVTYATTNANVFVAYGGVRLMKYNYTDGEWEKFCKKSSNLIYE